MLTLEQAKQSVQTYIGSDHGIVESSIIELPYGWFMHTATVEYIRTGWGASLATARGTMPNLC